MILVFFLFLGILFVLTLKKSIPRGPVFIALIIPLFFLVLWGIEYSLGRFPSILINDEIHYVEKATQGFTISADRLLFYLINYWIIHYDIYLGGLSLKLINIPIFASFLIILYKIFNTKKIFWLSLLLPYIAMCATYNFRDLLVWFFTASSIYFFYKTHGRILLVIISIAGLYFLRPIFGAILITCFFITELYGFVSALKRGKIRIFFLFFLILFALSSPILLHQSEHILMRYTINCETGGARLDRVVAEGYASGDRLQDFVIAVARYTFAPMPHSLFRRLLEGGSEEWGFVNDMIRVVHQFFYFMMLGYLALNVKWIYPILKSLSKMRVVLLLNFLIYLPVYSIHLYGVSHQRLKIPFQIVIFIICMLIVELKRRRRVGYLRKELNM